MAYPDRLSITVTIGGVDVTAYIDPGSFSIQSVLTHQVDTCSMKLLDADALTVNDWDELIVLDGATKIFGGYVLMPDETPDAGVGLDKQISASDYSVRFEKVMVKKVYTNMTDYAIISDLFTTYNLAVEGFDFTTYVESLVTHPQLIISQKPLTEVLNYLAKIANADWFIDPDKKLHFFITEQNLAPYGISDNPDLVTTFPATSITKNVDGSGVVNRVEIVGGMYLSDDQTFYLAGNGKDVRISLPFKLHAPVGQTSIQAWRNDGTYAVPIWTALGIGASYINVLGGAITALLYFQEKVLEQATAWPNLGNALKIVARAEIPLLYRLVDMSSYAFYGYRWFDQTIIDASISMKETAQLRAQSELMQNSLAKVAGSITTQQPGLRSGQIIAVNYNKPAMAGNYLIQRCTISIGINGLTKYTCDLGTYNADLLDLLIALARGVGPEAPWRTDEVLNELIQTFETVTGSEVHTPTATIDPYYFSDVPAEAMDFGGAGAFTP